MNLPCVASKADSLFLSQTCRMLTIPGNKQYMHIKYWLGLYMREYFPDMAAGPHAEIISPYFQHMKSLLVGSIFVEEIDVNNLKKVSAKSLYAGNTSSFPPPKIVFKYDVDWGLVWKRMQSSMLDPRAREVIFMLVNNIVANRDRLFNKFHMVPSPNCQYCNVLHDNVHLFCECILVREAWFWVRQRLLGLLPDAHARTSNFEFLNLMFEKDIMESEVLWMIRHYVQLVWEIVICKKKYLKLETMKSEYELRYLTHQKSNLPHLNYIVGLLD